MLLLYFSKLIISAWGGARLQIHVLHFTLHGFLFYSNALAKRQRQDEPTVLVLSGPQTDHSLSAGETIDCRKHQTL